MQPGTCPRCGNASSIIGDIPSGEGLAVTRFAPECLTRWARWLSRSVPITGGPGPLKGRRSHPRRFAACPACGLLWSSVDPVALRILIEEYGVEEAKADHYGVKPLAEAEL